MANKKDSASKPTPPPNDDIKYTEESKHDVSKPQFKIYVGIDFGTDGCGLAYALADGTSYIHNTWKDVEPTQKPRTSVLFDNYGNVQCIGNQAAMQYITSLSNDGWKLFERFKMSLFETPAWKLELKNMQHSVKKVDLIADQIQSTNNPNLFELSETVFVAQLKFLKEQATTFMKKNFKRRKKLKYESKDICWILTVPAIWSDKAKQQMKTWAVKAELINADSPNRLKIVYEPDCASLSIQTALLNNLKSDNEEKKDNSNSKMLIKSHRPKINIDAPFNKGDKYILVDVGGGTCDVACHEIMGPFRIAEVLHPSGGPWGGGHIDREFIALLHNVFSAEDGTDWIDEFIGNAKQNENMYQQLLQNFIETSKPTFYDYVAMNRTYHTVTVPYNFANFLIEKFEDLQAENESKEEMELINEFLAERCLKLYGNAAYIRFNELHYGFSLALHNALWQLLFDSIIDPIIAHCENILRLEDMADCKFLFLVGGCANSKYFQYRMQNTFANDAKYKLSVVTPELPQLCVVDGACRCGLRPNFMKVRRLSKTYGIQSNKLKSKLDVTKFPQGFIARKSYHNKQKNKDFVENCFNAFVRKNHAINIDDKPIRRPVYKIKHDQQLVHIVIYSSNKAEPQTADPVEIKKFRENLQTGEDCCELAKFTVHFDRDSNDKVWVEFSYSDTMLTVHAYPDQQYQKRQQIHIEYQ